MFSGVISVVHTNMTLTPPHSRAKFFDEWLTKAMFEGRFHTDHNAIFGAQWQSLSSAKVAAVPGSAATTATFAKRQRGRRERIGCCNWPLHEHTLRRVCEAISTNLKAGHQFIFGSMPSPADFAVFGQLRQLVADPFPATILSEYADVSR